MNKTRKTITISPETREKLKQLETKYPELYDPRGMGSELIELAIDYLWEKTFKDGNPFE